MGNVLFEDGDFKCIHRTGLPDLQRLVDAKKFAIFEIAYRDTRIKVEIKKKDNNTVVKRQQAI
jgi:hypothetical protein